MSAGLDSGDAVFFGEGGRAGPEAIEPTLDCKPNVRNGDPIAGGSPGAQVCGGGSPNF